MDRRLPPLLVTVFINIAGFSLILPLIPFFGRAFGASAFEITVLFSAYSFGNVFGEIFWGPQSDRWGRKNVLTLTTAMAALTYVAFAFAPSLWLAVAIRVVTGFFSGTMGVAQGFIADVSRPEQRAKTMGYFGAAFSLGFIFGPALGGLLSGGAEVLADYRRPILAAALLAGSASLWSLLVLRNAVEPRGRGHIPAGYSAAFRFVSGDPLLLRLLLIPFFGIAAFASMEAIFGLWTAENYGWDAQRLGFAFFAIGAGGIFAQLVLIGPMVARFGEGRTMVSGLTVLVVSLLLQPILRSEYASLGLMTCLMIGHSLTFPCAGALLSRNTPPDRQGGTMGLAMASNAVSRIIAPPMFGAIYGEIGHDVPWYVGAAMMALVILLALQVVQLSARRGEPVTHQR